MEEHLQPQSDLNLIQNAAVEWYCRHGREFPWRDSVDPYVILVAEKLLQQTAVGDHVVDVFGRVIAKYPTPGVLAQASVSEVRDEVGRLGLPARADHLVKMAQEIVGRHNGVVPLEHKQLLALTGVGEYMSRAVLCMAGGEDRAIVDTNVARFLHRFLGLHNGVPANPARNRRLLMLADSMVPPGRAKEYNLAILDICAAICKARLPKCGNCPLRIWCKYGNTQETLKAED